MSGKNGWVCSKCTFAHDFPGTRCVMCNHLRTTPDQIIAFVKGVPIPESSKINQSTVSAAPRLPGEIEASTATASKKKAESIAQRQQEKEDQASSDQPPSNAVRKPPQAFFLPQNNAITGSASVAVAVGNNSNSVATGTTSRYFSNSASSSHTVGNSSSVNHPYPNNNNNNNHDRSTTTTESQRGPLHQTFPNNNNHNNSNSYPAGGGGGGGDGGTNPYRSGGNTGNLQQAARQQQQQPNRTNAASTVYHNNDGNRNSSSSSSNNNSSNQYSNNRNSSNNNQYNNQENGNKRSRNESNPNRKQPPKFYNGVHGHFNARAILPYVPGPVPFDETTMSKWIFPINAKFPKRKYQQEMAESAIFQNSIVSLPTGLGKTMIAAVVMYNYYRWFPTGKIIFCAPTLPLVNQQVKAIYDIVGIPQSEIAVMTGKIPATDREVLWNEKRVFFCTAQTVQNDLKNETVNVAFSRVVCLVLDEVHKASGDHAYVKVVESLRQGTDAKFRILGLSATPGTDIKATQEVINVLGVSKIDCRFDDDPDIKPHTHDRCDEIAIVQETNVNSIVKGKLLNVMGDSHRELRKHGFLDRGGSGIALTTWGVLKEQERYLDMIKSNSGSVSPGLHTPFAVVLTVLGWRQSLDYGIGSLRLKLKEFESGVKKSHVKNTLKSIEEFQAVKDLVFSSTETSKGNADAAKLLAGNPKLMKLQEVLQEHFLRSQAVQDKLRAQVDSQGRKVHIVDSRTSTRAIVFSSFRDSVAEIVSLLETYKPVIKPARFVGQGKGGVKPKDGETEVKRVKGMNQAEQQSCIQAFRNGIFNVLVCTSIGEEGLDVGQCDLIVMFDTLQSPTRMIQRVGRTGRSRNGKVVLLLTQQEKGKYSNSKAKEKHLLRSLKDPKKFDFSANPPMFPPDRPPPVLCEQMGLNNDAVFRLSQVVGNFQPGKRKRQKSADGIGPEERKERKRWKLTEDEDNLRQDFLGSHIDKSSKFTPDFPPPLRKRFLKAREISYSAQTPADLSRYKLGSTLSIARSIQDMFGDRYDPSKVAVSRSFARQSTAVQSLFPLKEGKETPCQLGTFLERKRAITEATAASFRVGSRSLGGDIMGRTSEIVSLPSGRNNTSNNPLATWSEVENAVPPSRPQVAQQHSRPQVAHQPQSSISTMGQMNQQSMPAALQQETVVRVPASTLTSAPNMRLTPSKSGLTINPYKKVAPLRETPRASVTRHVNPYASTAARNMRNTIPPIAHSSAQGSLRPAEDPKADGEPPIEQPTPLESTERSEQSPSIISRSAPFAGASSAANSNGTAETRTVRAAQDDTIIGNGQDSITNIQAGAEFYLPTPPDSSSSEDEDDSDGDCNNEDEDCNKGALRSETADDQALSSANEGNTLQSAPSVEEHTKMCTPREDQGNEEHQNPEAVIDNQSTIRNAAIDGTGTSNAVVKGTDDGSIHASQPSFRLPTQSDSSSSEEESDEEEASRYNEKSAEHPIKQVSSAPTIPSIVSAPALNFSAYDLLEDQSEEDEDEDDSDLPLASLRDKTCSSGSKQVTSLRDPGALCQDSPENVFPPRRNNSKKRFDPFLTQVEVQASATETPQRSRPYCLHPSSGGLLDTPLQLVDTPHATAAKESTSQYLADTPPEANSDALEAFDVDDDGVDIPCVLCLSKDFHEDDPIVLCDGFGGRSCDLAVHTSCYSIANYDDNKDWRCDPCSRALARNAVNPFVQCCVCQKKDGPLKRVSNKIWKHPYCVQWQNHSPVSDEVCGICCQNGAVRCGKEGCRHAAHPHCAVRSIATSTCDPSWTLVSINFSSPGASVVDDKENCQSLMFCPRDREEARTIYQSITSGMGRQVVTTIPPDCLNAMKPRRLKKLAASTAEASKEVIDIDGLEEQAEAVETVEARQARKRAKLEERRKARHFFDEEAGIDSDEDLEGDAAEERDLAALDGEEPSQDSFINDSSQLGYSQDDLGRAGPDDSASVAAAPAASETNDRDDTLHRRLDNDRAQRNQYATPLLNRKMTRNSLTPTDAPSEIKGLGKMNFIRSVLEHHKNGGDADEIERVYNELEQEPQEEEAEVIDLDDDTQDNNSPTLFDYG